MEMPSRCSNVKVKLRSCDEEMFEVDEAVAFASSKTLEHVIQDAGDITIIPLPNVSSNTLAKVIQYCEYHYHHHEKVQNEDEEKKSGVCVPYEVVAAWDADFVEVNQATLLDLMLAATYLNIESLLRLTCQTIANMIKSKTPEEIRYQQ